MIFALMVFAGVLLLFPILQPFLSLAVSKRSISQASCLGFIFIDVFVLSKHLKIFVFRVMADIFGTVFLHLAVNLKKKPCNQGCLLLGIVWIDLIYNDRQQYFNYVTIISLWKRLTHLGFLLIVLLKKIRFLFDIFFMTHL